MRELPPYVYGRECGENEKVLPLEQVLAIQKQAYEDGLRDARHAPQELFDLFNFMSAAFAPMTSQQEEIMKQLAITKSATLTASQKEQQ